MPRAAPTPGVERAVARHRQAVLDRRDVGLDVGELVRAHDALEDVEAVAAVGVQDRRIEVVVRIEADRPPVVERQRPRLSCGEIVAHRRALVAVTDHQRLTCSR